MTQALFYQPSFERLRERIEQAAPGLDIVLINEQGQMTHAGKPVAAKDIQPEYSGFIPSCSSRPCFATISA